MTLIGAWVEWDRALCWADSACCERDLQSGRVGKPIGHSFKLSTNDAAAFAAVGAGDIGGNRHIAKAVATANSFDDFCLRLPSYLCEWARDRVDATDVWPDWICVAAGYSHRSRRVMASTFDAKANFAPTYIANSYALPKIANRDWLISITGRPLDVLTVALKQIEAFPNIDIAAAGTLTVAEVRRDHISVVGFDISTGVALASLPDMAPMGSRPHSLGSCGLHARPVVVETSPAGFTTVTGRGKAPFAAGQLLRG